MWDVFVKSVEWAKESAAAPLFRTTLWWVGEWVGGCWAGGGVNNAENTCKTALSTQRLVQHSMQRAAPQPPPLPISHLPMLRGHTCVVVGRVARQQLLHAPAGGQQPLAHLQTSTRAQREAENSWL